MGSSLICLWGGILSFFHIFGVPSEEEELGLGWLLMLAVIKSLHLLIVNVLYLNST